MIRILEKRSHQNQSSAVWSHAIFSSYKQHLFVKADFLFMPWNVEVIEIYLIQSSNSITYTVFNSSSRAEELTEWTDFYRIPEVSRGE